ncbi:serine/threonine-protein kinase [Mycobacterium sp. 852002-40037_SCH5390672]|uniref:serine/threonine-protein kinase n=1 Tax=Mycobacterium sp. 852002-40037_SCH5390672 TaxID=1834089 RepID=UPI0008052EC5|nr:serine/threonine-protein kinase [Mycobacterium sp. 852002-40037_SCH5390672]OBC02349.1 protein kinase [Mycobacterium sp. 852002-40037_SCH5390672]
MNTLALLAGRYEVRGKLGRGGMAEVCDGWDTRLRRPVAIKVLHPSVSAQSGMRNRFDAEAHAAAALNHPNIVAVYDSGEHEGNPFIVMERLPGETLAHEMARGPLPQERVHALLDNVLAALTAAHRAAILHRDIKPGNILLAAGGEIIKVGDFGIAKTPEATNTLTGHILGTIAYLSPERLAGAPACVADDLYAVGVVGYEALAGHRPFPQENMAALAGAILHGRPPPLAGLRPDVDPSLITVIERAMAHDPRQRFGSAEEMRAALHSPRPRAAGMQVAPPPHPATKLLEVPVPGFPTNTFVPALVTSTTSRSRTVLSILAVVAVLILIPLALALDASSSHTPPQPVTTSTPAPVPVSNAEPPPPPPTQQPPAPPGHGPGKGHGKGNGGGRGD